MTQARGRFMMYLADDDCVLGDSLAEAVATMDADPEVVITYAPWMLFDLVAQQPQGQFYEVPRDLRDRARPAGRVPRPHPAPPHLPGDLHRPHRGDEAADAARQRHRLLCLQPGRRLPGAGRGADPAAALLRRDHPLLRRRDALPGRQRRGRDRLGPLPRRPRVHDGPRRRRDRRRGAGRAAPAHPAPDRGAHVGGDPPAPCAGQGSARRPHPGDAPEGHGLRAPAAGADAGAGVAGDAALPAPGRRRSTAAWSGWSASARSTPAPRNT